MKKLLVSVFIMLVTLSICSYGEAAVSNLQQGKSEVGGNIDISSTKSNTTNSSSSSSSTSLAATYGYFLTDAIQLGGRIFATGTSSGSGSTKSESIFTYYYLEGKYHFYQKGQDMIPYLGLGLGSINVTSTSGGTSTSGSGSSISLMGGLKYFISENTSANVELSSSGNSYKMNSVTMSDSTTRLLLGFSYYF